MSRNKKKREAGEEQGSSWMDTYGDLVTLLLTFFVLLFSFSTIDAQKWKEIVASFTGSSVEVVSPLDSSTNGDISFNEGADSSSDDSDEGETAEVKKEFDQLYSNIKKHIEEQGLEAQVVVEKDGDEILIRLSDNVLFDSGSAVLLDDAKVIMGSISKIMIKSKNSIGMVRIEGHTDNRPISTSQFADNWELSTARSYTVLKYLLHVGMDSKHLSMAGYGDQQPIDTNATPEGRTKNRRVDFVIIRKS